MLTLPQSQLHLLASLHTSISRHVAQHALHLLDEQESTGLSFEKQPPFPLFHCCSCSIHPECPTPSTDTSQSTWTNPPYDWYISTLDTMTVRFTAKSKRCSWGTKACHTTPCRTSGASTRSRNLSTSWTPLMQQSKSCTSPRASSRPSSTCGIRSNRRGLGPTVSASTKITPKSVLIKWAR